MSVTSATPPGRAATPKSVKEAHSSAHFLTDLRTNVWIRFVLRRLFALVLVLIALAIVTFLLVRLIPGDPALLVGGLTATADQLREIRHQLGLDVSFEQQFVSFWIGLAHGNLGNSFELGEPVTEVIQQRVFLSLQLAGSSLALVMLFSIPAGMLSGALTREGRHKRYEIALTGITSVVGSIPEFLTATFLALIFAVTLRLLPVAGAVGWQSLILPVLAISLRPMAILTRLVRVETLNVLAMDYMRTARSKRLPFRLIYLRHVLPNVVTAALTVGGVLFAGIIAGQVVVENVFALPGMGTELVAAVLDRDYPVIQGMVLVLGVIVVCVNAIVDMLLAVVDPRSISRQA